MSLLRLLMRLSALRRSCLQALKHEQAQHAQSRDRQATHAPESAEVSIAKDGQDRRASLWLHGSGLRARAEPWSCPEVEWTPRIIAPTAWVSIIFRSIDQTLSGVT